MRAATLPEVAVGDVVEFLGNKGEVVKLYTSEQGTPRALAETVEGHTFDAPIRLMDVLFHDETAPAQDFTPTPGLWLTEEPQVDVEPRHIWA